MTTRPVKPCKHATPAAPCCPACRVRRARDLAAKLRKSAEKLAAKLVGATHCPRQYGPHGVCGGRLEDVVDQRTGRALVVCPRCERTARGLCLDCPAPVYGARGKARRCLVCRKRAGNDCTRRYREEQGDAHREKARARYWNNPEERARRNERNRLRRLLDPERCKAEKARHTREADPKVAERRKRYFQRYREKHREYYRQQARERYYRQHQERPTPVCRTCQQAIPWTPQPGSKPGRPPVTCDACCHPYERRRREAVRARRAAEAAERAAQKPKKVRAPKLVKRADGYRLCVGAGCERVVTGRKKKCSHCKQRDAELARANWSAVSRTAPILGEVVEIIRKDKRAA